MALILIEAGCDATVCDMQGSTALQIAIERHQNDIAHRLISVPGVASLTGGDNNTQPLHIAAIWGEYSYTVVQFFLSSFSLQYTVIQHWWITHPPFGPKNGWGPIRILKLEVGKM